MRLEKLGLSTADGLAPLPMQVSWVRDGILVVGMDNEMHVYSQWHVPGNYVLLNFYENISQIPFFKNS